MKKMLLALVAMFCIVGVNAQEWSVGGRVGAGFQVVGQLKYDGNNYIEARLGSSWNNPVVTTYYDNYQVYSGRVMADFSFLHYWGCADMDWTPSAGRWFFDAGVGVNVGGKANYAYVGVVGSARLGFTFNNVPLSLSFDWSPSFGPGILYVGNLNEAFYNELGLANVGITCTYNF